MKARETYQSIKADMSSRIELKLKELQALTTDDIIDTYKEDVKALSVLDGKYPGTGGIRTFVTGRDKLTYDFIDLDQYYIKDEVDELISKEENERHDDDDKLSKEIEDLQEALEKETQERIEEDQKEHDRSVEADEKIGEAVEQLREDLTTETEERKQADADEEAAREAADEQLQENIDAEAATREAADKQLQENIDTEEAERKAADQVLLENIDAEAAAREAADNILQDNIDKEAEERKDADTVLLENIDKEAELRKAADNTLQSNIDAEAETRENADNQLQANIDAEQKAREDADDNLQSEIDDEAATRENADNELWDALREEAATREANDNTLLANIDAEAKTREENDNTLQANIDTEQSEREAADNTLQSNIDAEQAAREAADDVLQDNIDNEAATRESSDQQLQENIDTEAAEREAADEILQANIDTKQNILTAGRGIDITEDVISCTFDHNVFIYCGTSLPEHPDEEDRYKIFLISNPNQTSEDNVLIEYYWIGESYLIGSWEKIGEFNAGIDLDLYYTKEEVNAITEKLQDQIDTNADNIATNTGDLSALEARVSTNETNIASNTTSISDLEVSLANVEANLQSQIDTNASNIAENTSAIETNTVDIANLQESKQDALTAGDNLTIYELDGVTYIDWNSNSKNRLADVEVGVEDNKTAIAGLEESKQDKLTAGTGISINEINGETIIAWTEDQRLVNVETGVSDNAAAIEGLEERVSTNETNIAQNTSDISALETKHQSDIDSLNALVSDLTGVEHADFENVQNLISNLQVDVSTNTTNIEANKDAIAGLQNTKQNVLQAGDNITILDDVISAVDTTYTAGNNINISNSNVISANLDDYVTETDLANLQSQVSLNAGDISVLQSEVNDNTSNINNLWPQVTSNTSDITTLQSEVASNTSSINNLNTIVAGKQDALVAGDNIKISDDVISAVDTTYTAGDNVTISNENVISVDLGNLATESEITNLQSQITTNASNIATNASNIASNTSDINSLQSSKQDKLTAGDNVSINNNVISAVDTTYSAGDNILISNTNTISADLSKYATTDDLNNLESKLLSEINSYGGITDVKVTSTDPLSLTASQANGLVTITGSVDTYSTSDIDTQINNLQSSKQDKLTAGTNITITGSTISSKDTTYTAGTNISISSSNVISATDTTYTAGTNISISSSNVISATDTTYTAGNNVNISNANVISVPDATASIAGVVKPYSVLSSNPSVNSATTTSGKYYPVQTTSNNALVVNVPWTDSGAGMTLGITSISASGTSPLTLSASTSGTTTSITGSVNLEDYYTKSLVDKMISDASSGVTSVSVSSNTLTVTPTSAKSGVVAITVEADDYYTKSDVDSLLSAKQDTLKAGSGITISSDNTISATGTSSGVSSISVTGDSNISVTQNSTSGAVTVALAYTGGNEPGTSGVSSITTSASSPLNLSTNGSTGAVTISGSVDTATADKYGVSRVGTVLTDAVAVQTQTSDAGRYYYVDMLGNGSDAGKLVVNVPWYASEGGGGGGTSLEKVVCSASSPLNLSGSVTDSGATLNLSGSIGTASEDNYGIVRVGSVIASGVAINNSTTTAGRYYHVDIMHPGDSNNAGRLVVNVPWEGNGSGITSVIGSALTPLNLSGSISGEKLTISGTIDTASAGNLGVVMPYYDSNGSVLANSQTTTSGRTYGIAGQSDGKLIVNVPWTDTTYTAGSGISISSSNVISSTSSYHHYEEVYSGNNDSTDYGRMYTHYNTIYGVFESVASSNLASGSNIYFTTSYIGTAGSLPEIYSRDDRLSTKPRAVLSVHPDYIKFTIDQLSGSEYSNEFVFDRNALYVGGTQVPVPQISANQTNPSADIYFYNSQLITGTISSDTTYNFHSTDGKKGAQVQIILQATKDVTVTLSGTYAKVTDGYTKFTVASNKYVEINAVYDGSYIYVRSSYMES